MRKKSKSHFDLAVWEAKTPKPPYASMQQAGQTEGFYGSRWKPGWPCRTCNGAGRIIDPMEQGDPVEGHKFSRRIECPKCKGTGQSSEAEFKEWYDGTVAEWQASVSEHEKIGKILKRLNRKLSRTEAGAVATYYASNPHSTEPLYISFYRFTKRSRTSKKSPVTS